MLLEVLVLVLVDQLIAMTPHRQACKRDACTANSPPAMLRSVTLTTEEDMLPPPPSVALTTGEPYFATSSA